MGAINKVIEIEQGSTWLLDLYLSDAADVVVDLTGWLFRGKLRASHSNATVIASMTFSTPNAVGFVRASLSATVTAAIACDAADSTQPTNRNKTKFVYDIEAEKPDGTVYRLYEGVAVVSPEVTR